MFGMQWKIFIYLWQSSSNISRFEVPITGAARFWCFLINSRLTLTCYKRHTIHGNLCTTTAARYVTGHWDIHMYNCGHRVRIYHAVRGRFQLCSLKFVGRIYTAQENQAKAFDQSYLFIYPFQCVRFWRIKTVPELKKIFWNIYNGRRPMT